MTNEKINAAIAEACGWCFEYGHWVLRVSGKLTRSRYELPDYCNDLNAMHEVITALPKERRHNYLGYLFEVVNVKKVGEIFNAHNATARQRAEAFLRTLGKWEEEK